MTYGAVLCSRNDGYSGDTAKKLLYTLSALVTLLDEVYYIDWNSPEDKPLIDEIREQLPKTGKLHVIVISQAKAAELTKYDPDVQKCCEVLARNIGARRLTTDFIISTNGDVMPISRQQIETRLTDPLTFYCIARTEIPFSEITNAGAPGTPELFERMRSVKGGQHGDGSPLGPQDRWSLITCCGDFQVAHRDLWHQIKGFDEDLVYRGYADSNIQRKADLFGFKLELVRDIQAFHSHHYPNTGSTGGAFGKWNEGPDKPLLHYVGTMNDSNWGFGDQTFEEEII